MEERCFVGASCCPRSNSCCASYPIVVHSSGRCARSSRFVRQDQSSCGRQHKHCLGADRPVGVAKSIERQYENYKRVTPALCLRHSMIDRFDALLGGGFVYPRPEEAHVPEMRLKDSEGVTLRQRKNQLRRRLGWASWTRNRKEIGLKMMLRGAQPKRVVLIGMIRHLRI